MKNQVANFPSPAKHCQLQPKLASLAFASLLLLGFSAASFAGNNTPISTDVSDATNTGTVTITISRPPGKGGPITQKIPIDKDHLKAADKATAISDYLNAHNVSANHNGGKVTLTGQPDGTTAKFKGGETGEGLDEFAAAHASLGGFGFDNSAFASLDSSGNHSTFTGGFGTDLGSFYATFTSAQLPNTSGDAIALALFNALDPVAAQYGVNLSLSGADIAVAFDPNYEVNGGEVFWGTTAPTDGSWGSITTSATPEPSTMLLVGSGVLGLGGLLRKRLLTRS